MRRGPSGSQRRTLAGLASPGGDRQFEGVIPPSRLRFAACLFAPLCAAPAGYWAKPGAGLPAVQRQYRRCLAEARDAVKTDRAIDRDILATRAGDWQRAGTLGIEADMMLSADRAHAEAVVARCMRGKGYRFMARGPLG